MRLFSSTSFLILLTAALPAQRVGLHLHLPASRLAANRELNSAISYPFMKPLTRLQAFYSAREAGAPSFRAYDLALRYDGPHGRPPVRRHAINEVTIKIGTTSVFRPTARFDANLSRPLTTVFKGRVEFATDGASIAGPHRFGGPGGELHFRFNRIVKIDIPDKGWFVVEITTSSCPNSKDPAYLDAFRGTGGPTGGSSSSSGIGCRAGRAAPPAAVYTVGQYGPGTAHAIYGADLGPGAPVLTRIGLSDARWGLVPLPFDLTPAGMPGCRLYTSNELQMVRLAYASGKLGYRNASDWLYVPLLAALQGRKLYEQHVSVVPGANAAGMITSNKRTVQLGLYKAPSHGVFCAVHGWDSRATIATWTGVLGLAMKIQVF